MGWTVGRDRAKICAVHVSHSCAHHVPRQLLTLNVFCLYFVCRENVEQPVVWHTQKNKTVRMAILATHDV